MNPDFSAIEKEVNWSQELSNFIKSIEKGNAVDFPQETDKAEYFIKGIKRYLDHNDEKYRGDAEGRAFFKRLRNFIGE